MEDKSIAERIYKIILSKNKFLSLKEIYEEYKKKYDITVYKDYRDVIRRHIYEQCLDRDLRVLNKKILFFSLSPKKTIGNQYGIIEWNRDIQIDDINKNKLNEVIKRLPNEPLFDDAELELAENLKKVSKMERNSRRTIYAVQALVKANYLCECNEQHISFIRKSNGKNYTEAHHLIPLGYQSAFIYSLDVPANIVSLCSNCHNMLHYGKNIRTILWRLYNLRIVELKKFKIDCSFEQLCEYYGVKK